MEKRKGEEKEGGTAKKKEEGKQWARRKEVYLFETALVITLKHRGGKTVSLRIKYSC